jgi:hypothetical protein
VTVSRFPFSQGKRSGDKSAQGYVPDLRHRTQAANLVGWQNSSIPLPVSNSSSKAGHAVAVLTTSEKGTNLFQFNLQSRTADSSIIESFLVSTESQLDALLEGKVSMVAILGLFEGSRPLQVIILSTIQAGVWVR